MVQAGIGGTFVNVGLTAWTSEADSAGADISARHILAGASVHAGVGLTLVVVDVTVLATPAIVTQTVVTIDFVLTVAMDTRVAKALVDLGEAGGVMVTLWTLTGEAVDAINAGATVVTRVEGTFVKVDVTHGSAVAGLAGTLVAIDLVEACPVVTWLALAVIQVDFTVYTCGAHGAGADVGVLAVLADASVPTGLTQTLVNVGLTQPARVTKATVAGEGGQAILTSTIVTGVRETLIDVSLTVLPRVTFSAFTGVLIGAIRALGTILARCAGALINIYLAKVPSKACGALTVEGVDLVNTFPIVQAGVVGALVSIDLAEQSLVAWHTDAVETSYLVEAGGFVLAGVGKALVDVVFTASSREAGLTLTLERTLGVQALPSMLTGVAT